MKYKILVVDDDKELSLIHICFCLILVMKYSRKMLDDKMSERTKEIFEI